MSSVKVILRADIPAVGKRGDIIDVSAGYARNFLFPKDLALRASEGAVAQAGAMRRSRDVKDAKDRESAEDVARGLVPKVITILAKAGSEGRLFGSVTAADVVEAVEAQTGVVLDRRRVMLHEPLKVLGTHQVPVRLHTEVQFPVTVDIVAR
jgi:large subunit ribosomal protein L9